VGEGVAAVAAKTEALAEKAMRSIKVEYEILPAVFDPFEAMKEGAPRLYEDVMLGEVKLPIERNIACAREVSEGNVEEGFKEADLIVEDVFTTGRVYHQQMETKSVMCRPEPDGGITVWPTAQSIHNTRQLLGRIFNIPLSKVNVHRVPIGGAFGSSIQMNTPIDAGLQSNLLMACSVQPSQSSTFVLLKCWTTLYVVQFRSTNNSYSSNRYGCVAGSMQGSLMDCPSGPYWMLPSLSR